uniref:UDP-N-acetylglucosamine transferase subunit ALG14 n=1 Tax=Albugo laibachii Nc14 TaxID=890382 RepID=F0W9J7_9STRA|nr:AlNc14C40G3455 [Albugo laibachii Nc14]|eukprot:CCA17811.1 AlNc14C40G3455 [Albugo laibachii Nc14]
MLSVISGNRAELETYIDSPPAGKIDGRFRMLLPIHIFWAYLDAKTHMLERCKSKAPCFCRRDFNVFEPGKETVRPSKSVKEGTISCPEWTGLAFKLPENPSHATLLGLFKKTVTEEAVRTNPARNKNQYVCCSFLERALVFWIDPCELLQMPLVTCETMRAKAENIRSTLVCDAATYPTRSWSAWFSRMGGSESTGATWAETSAHTAAAHLAIRGISGFTNARLGFRLMHRFVTADIKLQQRFTPKNPILVASSRASNLLIRDDRRLHSISFYLFLVNTTHEKETLSIWHLWRRNHSPKNDSAIVSVFHDSLILEMMATIAIILFGCVALWRGWSTLIPHRMKLKLVDQKSSPRDHRLVGKHERMRSRTISTMIVLGSGGHTTEMLQLIKKVNTKIYTPIAFVVASSDSTSIEKTNIDRHLLSNDNFIIIPRSREVGQSWLTSTWTTLYSLLICFHIIWIHRPELLLCNGPGTSVPVCVAVKLYHFFGILPNPKILFCESFARVTTLSLTGKLLYLFADEFVVHWPQLLAKYPTARYLGVIV